MVGVRKMLVPGLLAIICGTALIIGLRPTEDPVAVEPVRPPQSSPLVKPVEIADDVGPAPVEPEPELEFPSQRDDGCGKPPGFVKTSSMALPSNYDADHRHPLLIALHGNGQRPTTLVTTAKLDIIANDLQMIVAHPVDGMDLVGDRKSLREVWEDGDDLVRLGDLVNEIAAARCIDRSRIFVLGSGGAGKAVMRLSCEPWVTGVVVSGYAPSEATFACDTPKPVLLFTGAKELDDTGHRKCDARAISLGELEQAWAERNNCGEMTERQFGAGLCRRWSCDALFVSCVSKGGAAWPPGRGDLYHDCVSAPPGGFKHKARLWQFFQDAEPLANPPMLY